MNKILLKNIGAALAGIIIGALLSVLTDYILEKFGIFPYGQVILSAWMLILATIYRTIYTGFGAYFTAKLSATNPMRQVIIIGVIAVLANLAGIIVNLDGKLGPEWYPITLTILAFPAAWLGGKMYKPNN